MNQTMQLNERQMLEDSIYSQNYISACYNSFATECKNKQLQSALIHIVSEEHDLCMQLQDVMSARGWLQCKDAEQNEIANVKEMFLENSIE